MDNFAARALFFSFALLGAADRAGASSLFPDSPFSDKAAGTTAASFLKLTPGARAQALGGSYVAAVDNSEAVFWNPAGLARMQSQKLSELSFSYNNLLETSYASSLAYARPFSGERGVFGASFIYFSQSAIQGYDTLGDPTSDFTPRDLALSAAYARGWEQLLFLGASVKLVRSELAEAKGTAFAVDLGLQVRRLAEVGEGSLDLGLSVQNFGTPMRLGGESDPLPLMVTGGAAWRVTSRVLGLIEGHMPVDQDPYVSIGVEAGWQAGEALRGAFRAGFNAKNERNVDGLAGMTAGFGMEITRLRIDYAWVPLGDLGTTHRISMGVRF